MWLLIQNWLTKSSILRIYLKQQLSLHCEETLLKCHGFVSSIYLNQLSLTLWRNLIKMSWICLFNLPHRNIFCYNKTLDLFSFGVISKITLLIVVVVSLLVTFSLKCHCKWSRMNSKSKRTILIPLFLFVHNKSLLWLNVGNG